MPIKKIELEFHPANPLNEIVADINENFDAVLQAINNVNNGEPVVGPRGDKGDKGDQGVNGVEGAPGKDGKDGAPGRDGIDGKDGAPGRDGIDGLPGAQGPKGDTGDQGIQGLPGKDGSQGIQGPIGPVGPAGPQGVAGPVGPQGLKGDKGDTGAQGIQGLPGKDGVQGPKGDTGPQGIQGIPGVAGKDGVSITSAVVNSTGNLIITKSDGTTVDAGKVSSTTTTTSTTPAVGGALNPTASPIATTTTMKGYIAAYCNAGVFLTLDNLKFSVTTTGNRGLCCATVSGTATLSIAATYSCTGGGNGHSTAWPGSTITTTPSGSFFGYHFPNAGDVSTYICNDYNNQRVYRVHLQIGPGYAGNFISIERLL